MVKKKKSCFEWSKRKLFCIRVKTENPIKISKHVDKPQFMLYICTTVVGKYSFSIQKNKFREGVVRVET